MEISHIHLQSCCTSSKSKKKQCSSTAIAIVTQLQSCCCWWWFNCWSLFYLFPFRAQIFALLRNKIWEVKSSGCLRIHNGMWFPLIFSPLGIEIYSLIINHKTIINFQANIFSPLQSCMSYKYWGIKSLFSNWWINSLLSHLLKYFYFALVNHQHWEEHTFDMNVWYHSYSSLTSFTNQQDLCITYKTNFMTSV